MNELKKNTVLKKRAKRERNGETIVKGGVIELEIAFDVVYVVYLKRYIFIYIYIYIYL